MTAMDLLGLEVSSGSACSSGASLPNRVLLELGYSREECECGIRISLGGSLDKIPFDEIKNKLATALKKYYH